MARLPIQRIVAIGILLIVAGGLLGFPLSAYMDPPTHPTAEVKQSGGSIIQRGGEVTERGGSVTQSQDAGRSVATYLSGLYLWFLGFVGIAAFLAIVIGGVMWMFSTSLTSTASARRWITNAIWGIALAAASFLLLNTINPDLVSHGFDIEYLLKSKRPSIVPKANDVGPQRKSP